MTAPRQVFREATYLVSRRCSERRFFLKPCKATRDIFLYSLAIYAQRYGIQLHGFCVLSNHYHLDYTDTLGRAPDFQRDFDSVVARATNCAIGRWDSFWDRDSYSAVRLVTSQDMFDKLVYTLANPVAAGLVRRASEWPGLWSDPDEIGGRPITVRRPECFFDEKGNMPAEVQLQLTPPPPFHHDPTFRERLKEAVREAEELAAAKLEENGRTFLGIAGVLSQSLRSSPASDESRRGLNPRVACKSKWKRIETLLRLKEFVREHREALSAWRSGIRDVLFPPGTWHMRVRHAARCASSG